MQTQQIPIITSDYIISVHTMLQDLTSKVKELDSKIEKIISQEDKEVPNAPDSLEISLSFLAKATQCSKNTIERKIVKNEIPVPNKNSFNRYRYWLKSDLPKKYHRQIDIHYYEIGHSLR